MSVLNASVVTSAAFIDSFNPCAFGVMLMFVALLFSLYKQKRLIWLFGISYVAGIFITYLLIGLGILRAAHLFGIHGFFGYVAGILLIVFGIFHLNIPIFNRISFVRWMNSCHIPQGWQKRVEKGTILAAVFLGVLVGICEFPCSGGVYLGTVGLLATTATFWQGVGWLFWYNFIFVLPLVVILAVAGNKLVLDKLAKWQAKNGAKAKAVMGWVMIVTGITLLIWI